MNDTDRDRFREQTMQNVTREVPSYIRRGDRTARTGWVRWPDRFDLGDMGTAVYALVPETKRPDGRPDVGLDPFIVCLDADPVLLTAGESSTPGYEGLFGVDEQLSDPMLAAVCLGTCGRGFYDSEKGRTWDCTMDDLTEEGRALCDALSRLYDRPVLLVTLVDT